MLQTGDILDGRYEVDSLLGRGGMSTVFSGWDRTLGREVAIKVLASELVADDVFVERFEREARAAASLSHRNVVAVFDSGVDDGARFIVMEHVSGKTLAALLREGPMPVDQALDIAVGVAEALGAAHARGIVHRDIKPGNVMVGENGRVKVLDFGIARALAASSLTRASTVIGTAGYLSPEQADGRAVDARSDLYGLGCLLYEMLTLRPPFVADSAAVLVHQHLTRTPEPPSRFRREVSSGLDGIVLRCLAKEPRERYPRAEALAAALIKERAAGGSPAGPRAGGAVAPRSSTNAPRSRRRQRWIAAAAVAALGLALLLVLDQGSGRSGGPAATGASAAGVAGVAARDPKAAASGHGHPASTAPARPAAAAAAASSGQAGATTSVSAEAALSALIVSDQQHGLIDQRAAEAISRRVASLLAALASRDAGATASQLAQFAKRVDALAAAGHITTPAAAEALKAAAAGLAGTQLAGSSTGEPPAAGGEGDGGEGTPPAAGRGRGHHHDGGGGGGGGGSQD
ncbi:MAG TPA: protein kinase [Solirubrobacteraceae bacterium]|nr:protein kinase [Solirubrobacteraceae bacterium]